MLTRPNPTWIARTAALVGALLMAVAACGSDSKSGVSVGDAEQSATTQDADTSVAPTARADTTDAPTTDEPTTDAPTTDAPTTDASVTTDVSTTVAANFPPGWQQVDFFDGDVYGPLAEENWTGVVSPPLPAAGQPLADGVYPADAIAWDPATPNTLAVTVQRLDPCTELPEDACVNFGEPFLPTELGVNESTSMPLTISLDDTVRVGMIGYECDSISKYGNGADLAAFFAAFDTAYNETIAPLLPFAPDGDNTTIIDHLTESPANGFSGAAATCPDQGEQGLVFNAGGAPPLLMQLITGFVDNPNGGFETPPLTPITAMYLNTIEVVDGSMTLYFYGGFFS